ncbi:ceramide-1-phosphate transfer protein-like isoform X1 [Phyllopteryx taeniolatus]|uniref:ceramide-1-phosphate transfer protein-like isoform X1 n=1 Tax=Phyllopteryx taeniolatus TaxID=161469 RepID=UPI002AD304B2|nr:ceramide-1-phosphate transfer protein-like isoform X1 [Phyllopteryx taeniolatus]XP_061620023.1 ceramide-1-phosphate transfer protein-like isoform X1 [Phyllopteryx taeniolatus]
MVTLGRTALLHCLLFSAILALIVLVSSVWLPQGGDGDCGPAHFPCGTYRKTPQPPLAEPDRAPPLIRECPGQSFQASRLLRFLTSSLSVADDVLLEPYLQSWDQLITFMESLGPVVSFFSQKVKEKLELIRRLAGTPGPKRAAYRSVRSMAEVEIRAGVVDFTRRTDSGCRTLLRLHRSLLWLAMTLDGLTHAPDRHGRLKTPGELSSDAYQVALAPHHPWVLRQAAELVFVALPDREHFLRLVCAQNQPEAEPVLRVISRALEKVHGATQRILEEHAMLDLP